MKETVDCPKCGAQFKFETFPLAERAEKILDLTAFRAACPSCGAKLMLPYPCIYHDPAKRVMIRFIPRGFDLTVTCPRTCPRRSPVIRCAMCFPPIVSGKRFSFSTAALTTGPSNC